MSSGRTAAKARCAPKDPWRPCLPTTLAGSVGRRAARVRATSGSAADSAPPSARTRRDTYAPTAHACCEPSTPAPNPLSPKPLEEPATPRGVAQDEHARVHAIPVLRDEEVLGLTVRAARTGRDFAHDELLELDLVVHHERVYVHKHQKVEALQVLPQGEDLDQAGGRDRSRSKGSATTTS
eukprot:CAMPEP_0172629942 /NCGR_PEP_ID=MMETSP1068-20121228/170812_1 /TAXON_ID=35684 /ORGANISM="Pseudopedinella elastica, Strain CCMP716" /LENGTH=180 /DNA_ID=CAMNT_0013440625 /DNA_START=303 /DNA_END=847 /DNA_ORIENTATION=+